ncbi:hypothetical protein chiPu_0025537 [Chiloscyllium punctatum]|uniref:Secreted protein n=1 Tax=Chiloscyllium punctatum TaxID=137246 RepID=A0A401TGN8_CHIPU|nr:hypothetical protein [Chiloscyllium punctatum]
MSVARPVWEILWNLAGVSLCVWPCVAHGDGTPSPLYPSSGMFQVARRDHDAADGRPEGVPVFRRAGAEGDLRPDSDPPARPIGHLQHAHQE